MDVCAYDLRWLRNFEKLSVPLLCDGILNSEYEVLDLEIVKIVLTLSDKLKPRVYLIFFGYCVYFVLTIYYYV